MVQLNVSESPCQILLHMRSSGVKFDIRFSVNVSVAPCQSLDFSQIWYMFELCFDQLKVTINDAVESTHKLISVQSPATIGGDRDHLKSAIRSISIFNNFCFVFQRKNFKTLPFIESDHH